jgi:hypothetical protein
MRRFPCRARWTPRACPEDAYWYPSFGGSAKGWRLAYEASGQYVLFDGRYVNVCANMLWSGQIRLCFGYSLQQRLGDMIIQPRLKQSVVLKLDS